MDITTLAAWGEFIGGIAVVVSLIYLASQIRQNSRLMRASTASATIATNTDFSGLVVQDSEVARIFREGMADRSSLSEDDMQRFDCLLGIQFTGHTSGVPVCGRWLNRRGGLGEPHTVDAPTPSAAGLQAMVERMGGSLF
jgi:hypothetical protein